MGKRNLKPRTIVVGCDEQSTTVEITDQETLRLIAEIKRFLPRERRNG